MLPRPTTPPRGARRGCGRSGRQLDEEKDRRDAAAVEAGRAVVNPSPNAVLRQPAARVMPPSLGPSASGLRRYRLFGRADAHSEVVRYAEAWARKIQLNPTIESVRDAARQPHTEPIVTVAIRSDGSVESVVIVRSSGVPALDEAVRRIVEDQAAYPAFAPALAREFDVVEIRRTWYFDTAIRLY